MFDQFLMLYETKRYPYQGPVTLTVQVRNLKYQFRLKSNGCLTITPGDCKIFELQCQLKIEIFDIYFSR